VLPADASSDAIKKRKILQVSRKMLKARQPSSGDTPPLSFDKG
jgi:hypothetical protein